MNKKFWLLVLVCFAAFSTVAEADDVVRIGITQFLTRADGVSEFQAAAVGDILTRMLSNSRTIAVIERDRLDAIAAEHRLGMSGLTDSWTATEVGKLAGCQYMILGSVTNLTKKSSGFGIWVVATTSQEATATVDARVIDVTTGEVILTLTETGSSSQSGSMFSFYGITTQQADLSGMEGKAIAAAAASLGFKIRENLTGEYTTVVNTGKNITIDAGATSGVGKGNLYRVYVDGDNKNDMHTLAVIKVIDVHNETSVASVVDGGGKATLIQRGDKVTPITPEEAKDLSKRKAFAKERPRKHLTDVDEALEGNAADKSSGTQAATVSAASAFESLAQSRTEEKASVATTTTAPVSVNKSDKPLENQSTDPSKVIATYGLSSGEANTRRIAHLGANRLGNKKQAYDKFVELANSYEGDYLAAYKAGVVAQNLGQKDDAAAWFDKALEINPNYEPAQKAKKNLASATTTRKSSSSTKKRR